MQPFDDRTQAAPFQSPNYPQPDYPQPGSSPGGAYYGPPPGPGPGPYPPYPVSRPTNTLALAARVCSFIVAPLGIIFGHLSLSQIKRSGEDGRGLAIAGTVIGYVGTAFAALSLVFFLVFMGMAAAVHRAGTNHTYYPTPTTSHSPIGVPDSSAQAIKNAGVGDCIRRVLGAKRSDGTQDVTVYPATCGSSNATDKVIKRTNSTLDCTGPWVQTKAYSPPIVLCLSKLR